MSEMSGPGIVLASGEVIDLLDQPALIIDADGTIIKANAAYARLVNRTSVPLRGRNLCKTLDRDAAARLAAFISMPECAAPGLGRPDAAGSPDPAPLPACANDAGPDPASPLLRGAGSLLPGECPPPSTTDASDPDRQNAQYRPVPVPAQQDTPATLELDVTSFGAVVRMKIHRLPDLASAKPVFLCLGRVTEMIGLEDYNDLRNRELRWRVALESSGHAVWDVGGTDLHYVSDEWFKMRGTTRETASEGAESTWLTEVHESDREKIQRIHDLQDAGVTDVVNYQYRQRHKDGHWIWVMSRGRIVARDTAGVPQRQIGIDTDITTLKKAEAEAAEKAEQLKMSVAASGIGLWDVAPDRSSLHWNETMFVIHGHDPQDGPPSFGGWLAQTYPDDEERSLQAFDNCLRDGRDFRLDMRALRPDGAVVHVRRFGRALRDTDGRLARVIGVDIDITSDVMRNVALEQARAAMEYDSRHDALTGLGNRRLLDETFARFCEAATDGTGDHGVLHLDLDLFKQVNDAFGHAAGDALLRHVAEFTSKIVGDRGLVARVGGDEFVVFLPGLSARAPVAAIAEAIVAAARAPFRFGSDTCSFGISVGMATRQAVTREAERIFVDADLALYQAKKNGRSGVGIYDPEMRQRSPACVLDRTGPRDRRNL